MPQVSHGAVVQTALMGMALNPGDLLAMHLGTFAAIGLGMTLGDHRLVTPGILRTCAHPGHVAGLGLTGNTGLIHWGLLIPAFIL